MEGSKAQGVSLLYGSETGYSIEVCEKIRVELFQHDIPVLKLSSMDRFDKTQLVASNQVIVFVCSTCGEGDIPSNMKKLYRFLLKRSLPKYLLKNMKYSVFGLGDSSYQFYNFCSLKLFRRLEQLGAKPMLDIGLGDDQHYLEVEGGLQPYLKELVKVLKVELNISDKPEDKTVFQLPKPRFELVEVEQEQEQVGLVVETSLEEGWIGSQLVHKEELVVNLKAKQTYLLKLQADMELKYEPGDTVQIQPKNSLEDVDRFFNQFHLEGQRYRHFKVRVNDKAFQLPTRLHSPISLNELISNFIDLKACPNQLQLYYLSQRTPSELYRQKLTSFYSAENYPEFREYVLKPRRSMVEVLFDFNFEELDLNYLFELFHFIQPRSYSIGSYLKAADPNSLEIAVGYVQYNNRYKQDKVGMCSQFVKSVPIGSLIPIKLTKGTMCLPVGSNPIICIGPGLGILPFRSFLHRRIHDKQYANYLYFTGWYTDKDRYFGQELDRYVEENKLVYRYAGSRALQPKKTYVTDLMWEDRELLYDLMLNKQAHVYVCGSSGPMPKDVQRLWVKILETQNLDGKLMVENWVQTKRYQQEVW